MRYEIGSHLQMWLAVVDRGEAGDAIELATWERRQRLFLDTMQPMEQPAEDTGGQRSYRSEGG